MLIDPLYAFGLLAVVNAVAFFAQGLDKALARRGARRISERTLLWLGLPLGALGMWTGMRVFHHKTHKLSFLFWACFVTFVNLSLFSMLAWAMQRGWITIDF